MSVLHTDVEFHFDLPTCDITDILQNEYIRVSSSETCEGHFFPGEEVAEVLWLVVLCPCFQVVHGKCAEG